MAESHRRQLRNLLLDRRYQLHFTLIMVVIAAILTSGLGAFWYAEMRHASRVIEIKALATMSETEAQEVERDLASSDHKRLALLIGFGVLIALLIAGYGVLITHKVAGPIYKIKQHMRDIGDGKLYDLRDLRKGDKLHDFWLEFKAMATRLRKSTVEDVEALNQAINETQEAIATSPEVSSKLVGVIAQLRALRDSKQTSLDPH